MLILIKFPNSRLVRLAADERKYGAEFPCNFQWKLKRPIRYYAKG